MAHETANTIDPLFKVRNSPLQGVEAYRSPYYRRLLSAGYKGYLQGSLGGATLFGGLGALAGGVMALAAIPLTGGAAIPFLAIPIMAGAGLIYGKDAFGTIGAVAAISAEQAEMNEKRRSLLDRYYETPSAEEAKEIEKQLAGQAQDQGPKKKYHWRSGLLGAAVVALAGVIAITIAINTGELSSITKIFEHFTSKTLESVLTNTLGLTATPTVITSSLIAGAAILGGIVGSIAGIDRSYIRKWFDVQENFHDSVEGQPVQVEHHQSVEKLRQAYKAEGFGQEARKIPQELIREKGDNTQPISPRVLEPKQEQKPTAALDSVPLSTLADKTDRDVAPLKERARELA